MTQENWRVEEPVVHVMLPETESWNDDGREESAKVYRNAETMELCSETDEGATCFFTSTEVRLPWKWAICGTCRGNGSHSHRFGAISGDRLDEWRQDEESWNDYMSGAYDEACGCDAGKIKVVDRQSCDSKLLVQYDSEQEELAEDAAMEAAERRAEMGWDGGGYYSY